MIPTLLAIALPGQTQAPARADTVPRRLGDVVVTVARGTDSLTRLPVSAAVVSGATIRGAQATLGLDESLTTVPGVLVANRWNWSLDQRLSIRGFGSRANFGTRGVKVVLDGVPQTLPDGQSQLTNVEFAALEQIEVLTGAAGALYGNASGGVVSLTSRAAERPAAVGFRVQGGSFGTTKWLARASGGGDRASGTLYVSGFKTDGFRKHSAAESRQAGGSFTLDLGGATSVTGRVAFADQPKAMNPGALTVAEAASDPTLAAPNNVARGADKDVQQEQFSLQVRHRTDSDWQLSAAGFALWRDLDNPLATPPPGPFSPTAGTYSTIDRRAVGARVEARTPALLGQPLRLLFGFDLQRMRDDRRNERSNAGEPTGVVTADQREEVSEAGPFVRATWHPTEVLTVMGGLRLDRMRFEVTDRHQADGEDSSGRRSFSEPSASLGASLELADGVTTWVGLATAFETPTTTEYVATRTGTIGLNPDLGPQRARSVELGTRIERGPVALSFTGFLIGIRDAIVQAREQDGRAWFANAGRSRHRGVELGLAWTVARDLSLTTAATIARHAFSEYRLVSGSTADTLDGNALAGVPGRYVRSGVQWTPGGFTLAVDHLLSASLWADDQNTIAVAGWGAGVTNLRAAWRGTFGTASVSPFVAVMNAFDRRYIGSVTINGFGGRVMEPAPGRHLWVGLELDWRARAR